MYPRRSLVEQPGTKREDILFEPNTQNYVKATQQRLRCFDHASDMHLVGPQLRAAVEARYRTVSEASEMVSMASSSRADLDVKRVRSHSPSIKERYTGCNQYEMMAAAALTTARIKGNCS